MPQFAINPNISFAHSVVWKKCNKYSKYPHTYKSKSTSIKNVAHASSKGVSFWVFANSCFGFDIVFNQKSGKTLKGDSLFLAPIDRHVSTHFLNIAVLCVFAIIFLPSV